MLVFKKYCFINFFHFVVGFHLQAFVKDVYGRIHRYVQQIQKKKKKPLIKINVDIYLTRVCTMSPIRQILSLQFYSLQPIIVT